MVVLIVLAAAVAVLAVVLVANAVRLKPTPVPDPLPPADETGDDAAVERFREMLRCPTVWGLHDPEADRSSFDGFVPALRRLYPRVFDELELELVDGYGISLLWKGADRDLAPVVLMAHHDVVGAEASELDARPLRRRHRGRRRLRTRGGGHEVHLGGAYGGGRAAAGRGLRAAARRVPVLVEHRGGRRRHDAAHGGAPRGARARAVYGARRGRRGHRQPAARREGPNRRRGRGREGRLQRAHRHERGGRARRHALARGRHGQARVRPGRAAEEPAGLEALRAGGGHAARACGAGRLRAAPRVRQPVAVPPAWWRAS